MPEPIMAIAALAVITIALIGQAIEMRKIRVRTYGDDWIWFGICSTVLAVIHF